jgi:predicted RNA-binding protein Jag
MPASFRPHGKPGKESPARRHADPTLKMDREAVVAGLRRYLDAILPATQFDLRFKIELPGTGLAPAGRADAAAAAGNVDGNSLSGRSRAPVPLEAEFETPDVIVDFDGPDRDFLLERGAEVLKALEHLAVRSLRLEPQLHDRVRFDCGNYRADRIAELKLSAQVAAQRVRETHAPFRFNPMPARERRIIHLVLKDQPGVRTCSEGVGEDRHLVIYLIEAK